MLYYIVLYLNIYVVLWLKISLTFDPMRKQSSMIAHILPQIVENQALLPHYLIKIQIAASSGRLNIKIQNSKLKGKHFSQELLKWFTIQNHKNCFASIWCCMSYKVVSLLNHFIEMQMWAAAPIPDSDNETVFHYINQKWH